MVPQNKKRRDESSSEEIYPTKKSPIAPSRDQPVFGPLRGSNPPSGIGSIKTQVELYIFGGGKIKFFFFTIKIPAASSGAFNR